MAQLFQFQKDSVEALLNGASIVYATMGSGKTAIMFNWLKKMTPKKVLIVTVASKRDSGDMLTEADKFCGDDWRKSLSSFSVISWDTLYKWLQDKTTEEMSEWTVAFDECLPANTKVTTILGKKEISNIEPGDKVLSYNHDINSTEYKTVTRLIKKPSPQKMIRLLLSNGTAIISTDNHPHYTDNGYKEAKDIKAGDMLYEERSVHKTKICAIKSPKIWGVYRMWHLPSKDTRSDIEAKSTNKTSGREEELLLNGLRQSGYERKWKTSDGCTRDERAIENKGRGENDKKQPISKQKDNGKNASYKKEKRLATSLDKKSRIKRWKWALYRSSDKVMGRAEQDRQRLGNGAASILDKKRTWISDLLQIRCRQCILQDRGGVRWGWSQQPKSQSKRQEEKRQISPVRVESVEVFELSDIKRLGLYREPDYVYCLDVEDNHNFFANGVLTHNCQKCGSGVSSKRGKAFLLLSEHCRAWTGYTGTPGDTWIKFYPYFQATNKVRNKTAFQREFCIMQHYPFPKILKYQNEATLKKWWKEISYAPDTSSVMSQLPKETNQVVHFKKPKGYDKAIKTSTAPDGTFWDSNIAMHHGLAQMCCDTAKEKWLEDWFDGLSEPAVVFYNYKCEAEAIKRAAKKVGKGKVWLINGESHDIPTAETIGDNDIVAAQYLSGGESLNLQWMRYWCSMSYNWSYSTSKQAKGRIKRVGQTKPMFFYYLTTDKTIEEDKMKALQKKKDFSYQNWATEKGVWKDE